MVITTSNTHDPTTNPIAPPLHADAGRLAHPTPGSERRFLAGFRAYSSSKLCNLLTARALAALPETKSRRLRVIAYNPDSGYFASARMAAAAADADDSDRTPASCFAVEYHRQAGSILAEMTLGKINPPDDRIYASLVKRRLTWPEPSDLARRDDLMNARWSDSARLIGLPGQTGGYAEPAGAP